MIEIRIAQGFGGFDEPIEPDAAFAERLYTSLLDALVDRNGHRPLPRPRLGGRTSSGLLALAAVVVLAVVATVLVRLPSVGPGPSPSPSPTARPVSPPPSESATSSISPTDPPFDPSAPGVANDAPCSRHLTAGSLALAPVPYRHEDLERMVLDRNDVGGLAGFELDMFGQGYQENAEVTSLAPNPSTTCDDVRLLGRIEGYGNVYASTDQPRTVAFDVHLFWRTQDAAAWMERFTTGLANELAASGQVATFQPASPAIDLAGASLWVHTGADGVRTWAFVQRGPVVAWIVDLHPSNAAPTIDVVAASSKMAARIESVEAEAATRARAGLDVAQLLSAPLPRSAWGDLATGLVWDPVFGGCQDTAERGFVAGESASADAVRYGRVSGCYAMYDPPGGGAGRIVRLFSAVNVYSTAEGAAGALESTIKGMEALGGTRFAVQRLGDEAVGISSPSADPPDMRIVLRIGTVTLGVVVQGSIASEQHALVEDLARQLEARFRTLASLG